MKREFSNYFRVSTTAWYCGQKKIEKQENTDSSKSTLDKEQKSASISVAQDENYMLDFG